MDVDVVVIGAGAAGMMCAGRAAARGRRVLLVDHWRRIGERIRISGGGRCNVTNRTVGAEHYLSRNPHFCRSALARFTPDDILGMLDRHGVAWEERDRGQVFCTRSAQDVIAMLRAECDRGGVQWAAPCTVDRLDRLTESSARFRVATSSGTFECESVVVATGGLAAPALGATPFGYEVARQFGLPIVDPRPALVPLTLSASDFAPLAALTGVAFECAARVAEPADSPVFRARGLVTHRGVSGPAVLQVSSYWQFEASKRGSAGAITIDLAPGIDVAAVLAGARQGRRALPAVLGEFLPRRLADAWCDARGWPHVVAELSNRTLAEIAASLSAWTVVPSGTLGFDKAEVTLGGVDTDSLSSRTMEARDVSGLFFIGEVVDVTGWLGGYNFQWAWASGWAAGEHA
jgi:predicted Rossmann fold flavoprotein